MDQEWTALGKSILDLLQQGKSYNTIVAEVGCSKSNVNYYAKKLGTAKKLRIYDWKIIQVYHDQSNNMMAQCKRHFGFSSDAWDKAVERGVLVPNPWKIPLEDLLVSGRNTGRRHLKDRLFNAGEMEPCCHECGLVYWRGKKLPLELHHINGIPNDNRRENLIILCPNCHSLTPNYCGKNKKRRKTP